MSAKRPDIDLDKVQPGDIVASRWSTSGAHWYVLEVGELQRDKASRIPYRILRVHHLTIKRTDHRSTRDLVTPFTACEICKQVKPDVRRIACGYYLDVHDETEMETICEECENEHVRDI